MPLNANARRNNLRPAGVRLVLFGEVFSLSNTADLVGYGGNLANPPEFGQPGANSTQVFGSSGPRAFRFGARISF